MIDNPRHDKNLSSLFLDLIPLGMITIESYYKIRPFFIFNIVLVFRLDYSYTETESLYEYIAAR